MISDFLNQDPKLLVSDSLKESLPEEIEKDSHNSFITVALVMNIRSDSLIGSLVGVEFSTNPKFDLKVSLHDAFNFISNVLSNESNQRVLTVILSLGEKNVSLSGPYDITNAKIIEIDPINKMCILAVDLIRDTI